MKKNIALVMLLAVNGLASAASVDQQVQQLEPYIAQYPPNFESQNEGEKITADYRAVKKNLDAEIHRSPSDMHLLFLRGHLQSMGHNLDAAGAWEGATADLTSVLKHNPHHQAALLELGKLWVNSRPDLSKNAEILFRQAQCESGNTPLEEAQRGVFIAMYYQGKMAEAYQQAQFLHQQWPEEHSYTDFADMALANLKRSHSVPDENSDKSKLHALLKIADCHQ